MNTVNFEVRGCLPGYHANSGPSNSANATCVCDTGNNPDIVRCDDSRRYLYLRVCELTAVITVGFKCNHELHADIIKSYDHWCHACVL